MFSKIATLFIVVLSYRTFGPGNSADRVTPQKSVLLLRNGEVLCGAIAKVGDRYVVTLGNGSELRIAVREVEMHCLDLDEVYLRKRASLTADSIAEHLSLADWCLCNSLHHHAADELLKAITIDPCHPRIAWFERRLQSAITQPSSSLRSTGCGISCSESRRAGANHAGPARGCGRDFRVPRSAAAIEPLWREHVPRRTGRVRIPTCPSRLGKDRHSTIHTAQSARGTASGKLSIAPHESPLLLAPSAPHGNVAGAIFSERDQPQLRVLVDWVSRVTRDRRTKPVASTLAEPSGQFMQASYEEPMHLPQAGIDEAVPTHPSFCGPSLATTRGLPDSSLAPRAPRDPFDPEVFNRRYHRVAGPPVESAVDRE